MSSGTMMVRFPDGEVRYGIFHGTANLASPPLFATSDEAWEHHRKRCDHERVEKVGNTGVAYTLPTCIAYDEGAGEPVECWTNYGGEWTWKATATKTHVTSNHDAEGEQRGTPDWVSS
jgi:hypothetical protein